MNNSNYFLLRRLHSLMGVIPLGIFLFNHLLTNSTAVFGAEFFERKVALIHSLGPFLPIVEAIVIFIPLAIHIVLGIVIALQSVGESGVSYARNWAFRLQRLSGWIALGFIVYHVIHLRFLHNMMEEPFSIQLYQMFQIPWFVALYLVGAISVIYHFANGLCTFCMSWGITVSPKSQRFLAYAAAALGIILTIMAVVSIISFMTMEDPTPMLEQFQELHRHGHLVE